VVGRKKSLTQIQDILTTIFTWIAPIAVKFSYKSAQTPKNQPFFKRACLSKMEDVVPRKSVHQNREPNAKPSQTPGFCYHPDLPGFLRPNNSGGSTSGQ
jgi:hypothetical protein